jgi:hypothetical protein
MNKYDVNSDKFTQFIKEKEVRSSFSYEEDKQPVKEVWVCLHHSEIKIFCKNALLVSAPVDKSFKILQENLNKYELRVSCVENDEIVEFKITAFSLDQFLLWRQALQISKRPENVDLPNCFLCHKSFGLFRRRYNCKSCGNPMCSKCCPYQTVIVSLGYSKKQNLCKDCVNEYRNVGSVAHGSLMMTKKLVDTRSVLE